MYIVYNENLIVLIYSFLGEREGSDLACCYPSSARAARAALGLDQAHQGAETVQLRQSHRRVLCGGYRIGQSALYSRRQRGVHAGIHRHGPPGHPVDPVLHRLQELAQTRPEDHPVLRAGDGERRGGFPAGGALVSQSSAGVLETLGDAGGGSIPAAPPISWRWARA